MVDIKKAIRLRKQDKTYQEIADILQCSVAWCKLMLKDYKKPSTLANYERKNSIEVCPCCGKKARHKQSR